MGDISLRGSPHWGDTQGSAKPHTWPLGTGKKRSFKQKSHRDNICRRKSSPSKGKGVLCQHWEDTVESAKNKLRIPEAKKQGGWSAMRLPRKDIYDKAQGTGEAGNLWGAGGVVQCPGERLSSDGQMFAQLFRCQNLWSRWKLRLVAK